MRAVLLYMVLGLSVVWSDTYALIVTVGKYARIEGISAARKDARAYSAIAKRLGADTIVKLEDENATRRNIRDSLSRIEAKLKRGDRFFMFFSGHGSSLYDPFYSGAFQAAGMTEMLRDSGVLLPYDFNPERIASTVIVGKRDLRPVLTKIDEKIDFGMVVFDACYTETTVRGEKEVRIVCTPYILTENEGYPYRHIVYVASSIAEAQSGIFSSVLERCVGSEIDTEHLKACLSRYMRKRVQIPAVITPQ